MAEVAASILSASQRAFLANARRAVLATTAPDGHARLVPICFVLEPAAADDEAPSIIWSPIDEKPKATTDPLRLARVRDILERPQVSLLVDRWSEDWTGLGWVRCVGAARVVLPGEPDDDGQRPRILESLRAKYSPYRDQSLEDRPLLQVKIERVTAWGKLES